MSGWLTAITAVLLLLVRASKAQSDLSLPQFIQQEQQQQPSGGGDAADLGAKTGQPATVFGTSNITKPETALTRLTDSTNPVKAAAAVRRSHSPLACTARPSGACSAGKPLRVHWAPMLADKMRLWLQC